jgi:pyruvate dehydrogenase E1 component beta subunit
MAPVKRVTGYDTIVPYAKMEKHYLPTAEKIIKAVEDVLSYEG